ncbi:ABC transporter permease subunit [Actinomadura rugatobispora]|uniref:ATP-binding cassette domain-containing protein n=1 Tax=Actinomadura rugatobispora TaxID=1994 RepID=A0ABW0ZXR1_9ACTN|nr:branched-chain amino acid ABC transporter permease/ATP-binding protein [Actinomadura rugatobispora]
MNVLLYAIIGLGSGAVYGLLAQGIVAVYRSSGVLNFAQGAIAMAAAYLFVDLRHIVPAPIAVVAVTAGAAAFGVLFHAIVMTPMRRASTLAKVAATLGLFVTLQSAVALRYGTESKMVPGFLPSSPLHLWSGAAVGLDRLILLLIAVVVTLAAWYAYRSTQFGRLTTGVWHDPDAVGALGGSPRLVAGANWAIGSGLAGLCGCLIAPLTGLQTDTLSMLVVPAVAAAIAGGFSSFPGALAAGLAIGAAESVVGNYVSTPGWSKAVPFLGIAILFVARGRSLPVRSEAQQALPAVGRAHFGRTGVAGVVLVLLLAVHLGPASWVGPITATAMAAIVALSVVLVTGYAGQLTLAPLALSGAGALLAANASHAWGWPLVPSLLAGAVLAVPVGLAVALPALRTRGANLAAITLALGVVVNDVAFNNPRWTGGFEGLTTGPLTVLGWSVDANLHPERYADLVLALLLLVGLLMVRVRRGPLGRQLLAVRGNERAAASVGISVGAAKLVAFSLAAFIAGLYGVLTGFQTGVATFTTFDAFSSILLVSTVVLAGVGYSGGAIVAGVMASGGIVSTWLGFSGIADYLPLISGLALMLTLVVQPSGIVPETLETWRHLGAAAARRLPGAEALRNAVAAVRRGAARPHPRPQTSAAPDTGEPAARPAVPGVRAAGLRVEGLSVRFGEVRAVDGLSLAVAPGEILGLIGPNGAGKTTAIDAVTGLVPAAGRVMLGGKVLSGLPPHRRAGSGLGRSFQGIELFEDLTVGENVMVGHEGRRLGGLLLDLLRPARGRLSPAGRAAVELFGLGECSGDKPGEVSFGLRRLAGIARAVSGAPSVLLLDEPAAGLGPGEVQELITLLRRLARDGNMAIILVEHHMEMVMAVCDRVHVMNLGRTLAVGTPEEIERDPAVRAAYLGDADPDAAQEETRDETRPGTVRQ